MLIVDLWLLLCLSKCCWVRAEINEWNRNWELHIFSWMFRLFTKNFLSFALKLSGCFSSLGLIGDARANCTQNMMTTVINNKNLNCILRDYGKFTVNKWTVWLKVQTKMFCSLFDLEFCVAPFRICSHWKRKQFLENMFCKMKIFQIFHRSLARQFIANWLVFLFEV